MITWLAQFLWSCWYRVFPPSPPRGKVSRENPLEMADLEPLFTALRRIGAQPTERNPE